jgi:hypothetical protein
MLDLPEIARLAKEAASANLSVQTVETVVAESTVDSVGDDALRVVIVVRPESVSRLQGEALVDTLLDIQTRLQEAGENRLPIVEYATAADLADDGDPES